MIRYRRGNFVPMVAAFLGNNPLTSSVDQQGLSLILFVLLIGETTIG